MEKIDCLFLPLLHGHFAIYFPRTNELGSKRKQIFNRLSMKSTPESQP